jgi:sortase A
VGLALRLELTDRSRWDRWAGLGEIGPVRYLWRASLAMLALVALGLLAQLTIIGGLEHWTAQTGAFNQLRRELALGVAPTGQVTSKGRLVRSGAPMALLTIRAIGLRQVVLDGTSPEVLMDGPGLLRDTVLPGQAGTSVIFGRKTAYGGPFGGLHRLQVGDKITVTTGSGTSTFSVIDLRRAGDPIPPPVTEGSARLTLLTATGGPFMPDGVLRVDADVVGTAQQASALTVTSVPSSQLAMGIDTTNLWVLVLLLQLLIVISAAVVFSWRQWGPAQTWIVFLPIVMLIAYYATAQITRLLPNLT